MTDHSLRQIGKIWKCSACGWRWQTKPRSKCPGVPRVDYDGLESRPDLVQADKLERRGLKLAPGQQPAGCVINGSNQTEWLYSVADCLPLWAEGEPHVIARGQHLVSFTPNGERCTRCERVYIGRQAWGDCAGVKQYDWDKWPEGFHTEKQIREKGLRPGAVRGAVYYSKNNPPWLWLYRLDEATPPTKPRSAAQLAATERMKAANKLRWTCRNCGQRADYPAKGGGLCRECDIAHWAAGVLASDFVVLDTETTGLQGSEIIQIGIVDKDGRVLVDSLVKPSEPIDETGRAFEINGISNAMVAGAPSWPTVYPQVQAAVAGKLIVAYNVNFDRGIVEGEIERYSLPDLGAARWTCAMESFAEWYGERRGRYSYQWHSLSFACRCLDVEVDAAAHTAAGDCLRTLGVVKALAARWTIHRE